MTTIFFVRHAQPDLSIHDEASRPLSSEGQLASAKLVTFFEGQPIDACLSSPYKRALDTISPLADARGLTIRAIADLRERKVSDSWLSDFEAFSRKQWQDFSFKLAQGESLKEVQQRNIHALTLLLEEFPEQTLVLGTHGTALSTMINYYDQGYGYAQFEQIRGLMPWIVKMTFVDKTCLSMTSFDLLKQQPLIHNI